MKGMVVPLIILAMVCAGCPPTLTPDMMTSQQTILDRRGTGDILVTAFGATDISKTKPVQFTDEAFAKALRSSLEHSRLFRKALSDSPGHYQLQATVTQLDEDIFGINMTASMTVSYILAQTSPKQLVWEQTINSSHTAGMSDSVISITRVQRATEGAARKNIEQAIQEISKLNLDN